MIQQNWHQPSSLFVFGCCTLVHVVRYRETTTIMDVQWGMKGTKSSGSQSEVETSASLLNRSKLNFTLPLPVQLCLINSLDGSNAATTCDKQELFWHLKMQRNITTKIWCYFSNQICGDIFETEWSKLTDTSAKQEYSVQLKMKRNWNQKSVCKSTTHFAPLSAVAMLATHHLQNWLEILVREACACCDFVCFCYTVVHSYQQYNSAQCRTVEFWEFCGENPKCINRIFFDLALWLCHVAVQYLMNLGESLFFDNTSLNLYCFVRPDMFVHQNKDSKTRLCVYMYFLYQSEVHELCYVHMKLQFVGGTICPSSGWSEPFSLGSPFLIW